MNKVRLTESQLHNVIKESVKKVLNEIGYPTRPNNKREYIRKGDPKDNEVWSESEPYMGDDTPRNPLDDRDYFTEDKHVNGFASKERSNYLNAKKHSTVMHDKQGNPIFSKFIPKDENGIPKAKKRKISESQLSQMIREKIEEVTGYQDTMQKANKNFDPNTFRGKIGRKLFPQKAQQYDRVNNNAQEMSNGYRYTIENQPHESFDIRDEINDGNGWSGPDFLYYGQRNGLRKNSGRESDYDYMKRAFEYYNSQEYQNKLNNAKQGWNKYGNGKNIEPYNYMGGLNRFWNPNDQN